MHIFWMRGLALELVVECPKQLCVYGEQCACALAEPIAAIGLADMQPLTQDL